MMILLVVVVGGGGLAGVGGAHIEPPGCIITTSRELLERSPDLGLEGRPFIITLALFLGRAGRRADLAASDD